jgi:hypothetical protein
MNDCGYVMEHIECDEYIVPDNVDFINCTYCKIKHLIFGNTVTTAYCSDSTIERVSINSDVTIIRIYDCDLSEINVINNQKLSDICILDLHNNNLTEFNLEFAEKYYLSDIRERKHIEIDLSYNKLGKILTYIPKSIRINFRGNPDIKMQYLDFIFDDKDIRYGIGDCIKTLKIRYLPPEKREELYHRVINLKELYIDLKEFAILI